MARSSLHVKDALDFDALTLRIHPAASRVKTLAAQSPASVVFFDLLQVEGRDLRNEPFSARRAELERALANVRSPLHLTPATRDRATAQDWFTRFEGAGLDGVIAKPIAGPYTPDKRTMLKIKHERDCDCVVGGFRWHKDGEGTAVGSLLLGLFNDAGKLQHVGVCASFTAAKRKELVQFLAPYREDALRDHPWADWADDAAQASGRMPGGQSRWNAGKDLSWEPIRVRACCRGRLRAYAGRPVSTPRPLPPLAPRQATEGLHLRATRSRSAAGTDEHLSRKPLINAFSSRRARVGSSSGSGTPCAGRIASGTFRRFTRMRYQTYADPRMRSTSTSSAASSAAASG